MWQTLAGCFVMCCFINWFWYRRKTRPIIHKMESDKWQYIADKPFPHDIKVQFLVTDGNEVDWHIKPIYDHNGILITSSYRKTPVIAWMPFPEPPPLREFQCQIDNPTAQVD